MQAAQKDKLISSDCGPGCEEELLKDPDQRQRGIDAARLPLHGLLPQPEWTEPGLLRRDDIGYSSSQSFIDFPSQMSGQLFHLTDKNWVLTAAHCVDGNAVRFS